MTLLIGRKVDDNDMDAGLRILNSWMGRTFALALAMCLNPNSTVDQLWGLGQVPSPLCISTFSRPNGSCLKG